jgi:hypothetical protein
MECSWGGAHYLPIFTDHFFQEELWVSFKEQEPNIQNVSGI